ncbi:cupin domain-containing protein [Pseudomonas capsici]|uniref:cupin domain-containing protein n=1 Tax=Pseudomonas capsici TaxID=2810614 RepID=UPI0019CF8FE0|nr:cupin domain-containing protein [Pseudomonas capsici]MBN6714754.1 cupin domain-containing protein [Pseudomonas capsici]MBN6719825.1 cupin domain-containing protein [Pseudomonas capsici]MBN6724275.1 cupin domain-containing protein [Pseudomonas capsici]MBX8607781.1 cupin domain-containing protein [Pseudomonas cichorii]
MSIESIVDFSEAGTTAEHYRPPAEKLFKGDPQQTIYNHYNSPCGQMNAGVWEGTPGQWRVNYTEHEYCEIVQGVSVLRDEAGRAKTLRAGDRFVIPAGFKGTWEVLETCRKIYVVFEEKDINK